MTTSHSGSVTRGAMADSERSLAPDLARGFMLLLIALAYAATYLVAGEAGVGIHPQGGGALDRAVRFGYTLFLDNRAYIMFAVLFGYGMSMVVARQMSAGTSEREVRRLLRRRSLFLLLFGLVHGAFVFPGEILGPYGVAGLLLAGLLFRPDRALFRTATVLAPIYAGIVLLVFTGAGAADEPWMAQGPDSYGSAIVENLIGYPVSVLMVIVAFPLLLPIVLGIWAGRHGVLDRPHEHAKLLRRTAVIGITISVVGAAPLAFINAGSWDAEPIAAGALTGMQILTGVFGGLGYAAMFGVISARFGERRGPIARAIAATGKRSLSAYLLQSTLLMVVLSAPVIGLGAQLPSAGAAVAGIVAWLVGVALSVALERSGRRGPADALLRRLIYRPARRTQPSTNDS